MNAYASKFNHLRNYLLEKKNVILNQIKNCEQRGIAIHALGKAFERLLASGVKVSEMGHEDQVDEYEYLYYMQDYQC